jgi:hypothetical protein
LDIAPDDIYFACVKYEDIPFDKIHERGNETKRFKRATGAGFKYDFKYDDNNQNLPKHNGIVKTIDDIVNIFKNCLENKN